MHLALAPVYDGQDVRRFALWAEGAAALGLPPLATARPLLHHGRRRRLADVLTAIRTGTQVDTLGRAFLPLALRQVAEPATADAVGGSISGVAIYLLMALVLIFKPRGLFQAYGQA